MYKKTLNSLPVLLAVCCMSSFDALAGIAVPASPNVTFSIDWQGPTAGAVPGPFLGVPDSFFASPIDEGAILTPALPGPFGPNPAGPPMGAPGRVADAVPPPPGPAPRLLGPPGGLAPGAPFILPAPAFAPPGPPVMASGIELDALSYGKDTTEGLVFSVDEWAVGLFGFAPNVTSEGAAGSTQAAADVFAYTGPAGPVAPGPVFGNISVIDGDAMAPPAPAFGIPGLGLIEPLGPAPPVPGPDASDNLDALDIGTTHAHLAGPIFFSLDSGVVVDVLEGTPGTGTAAANGFSGADVICDFCGGVAGLSLFAAAGMLGPDIAGFVTDDLDALLLRDLGILGTFEPGIDTLLFSVRRGSAVIGVLDSAFAVPIEEGDILTIPTGPGLAPAIFIGAEALGLSTARLAGIADDLDALSGLSIPIPATLPLMASAIAGLVFVRRRRTA